MLNLIQKSGGKVLDLIEESSQKEIHLSVAIILRILGLGSLYLADHSTLTAATTRSQEPISSDPRILVANVKIYSFTKVNNSCASIVSAVWCQCSLGYSCELEQKILLPYRLQYAREYSSLGVQTIGLLFWRVPGTPCRYSADSTRTVSNGLLHAVSNNFIHNIIIIFTDLIDSIESSIIRPMLRTTDW